MDREACARDHPLRAEILALYEADPARSLAPGDLLPELDQQATPPLIAYHVLVLRNTGLLPGVTTEGDERG